MGEIELALDGLDRVAESVPAVLDGLSTDDAAWRPYDEGNSIGWLVWHLTRVIDDHLAAAFGDEQVIATDGHAERLGLDRPAADTGYADSADQVAATRFADPAALVDYHAAVQARAREQLAGAGDLDRIVDERWDPPVTLGVRLVSVVDDAARHIGQAQYVRGLLEARA